MEQQLKQTVFDLLSRGISDTEIRRAIREISDWGKTKSNETFNKWKKEFGIKKSVNKVVFGEQIEAASEVLEFDKKYVFNSETREYIVFLKSAGKNIVVPESLHKGLMKAYMADMPLDEMGIKFTFPVSYIPEYKTIFNWTRRGGIAITDEEAMELDVGECAERLLEEKKFDILQEFNKRSWQATAEAAKKWQILEIEKLNPFESFVEKWSPPKYEPVKEVKRKTEAKRLIIGLSDLHFGLYANQKHLYLQKGWTIEDTKKAITDYGKQIQEMLIGRKHSFEAVDICLLGDLVHSLSGFTDKGTKLETHPLGEDQLDTAFSSLVIFFQTMLELFPQVNCFSVPGNHDSKMDYTLSRMLSIWFKSEPRISFEVTAKRFLTFKIYNSLFLMEHGYAATTKSRLPKKGTPRNNYVNEILLATPELLQGVKQKYFLSADQHHTEVYEENSYEGYMFPTLVGGCRFSDNSLYQARQRQTGLVVGQKGVEEVLYFYFD